MTTSRGCSPRCSAAAQRRRRDEDLHAEAVSESADLRRSQRRSCGRWSQRQPRRPGGAREVSFAIAPGEFTGLIGSNGAGKTTLFRVILGLQAPSAGSVLVGGRPRSRRNPLIGYVPQKFLLDPDMPLRTRDLVGLGLDAHGSGIPLPSRARRGAVERDARRRSTRAASPTSASAASQAASSSGC